ncbi:MAG: hypothetical protein REI96_06395 [Flavobacterium nitrogenifigens]|uniref:hypothetical protein n=1 Tax=Flavobacterium nitrogenifigens TaxID=1617283 RepID=UPI002808FA4A|nr:hypothetical protein [Flavobacterium nitrogenifigens]MDQ8012057.1 hypothetical protein [Flavobacterium nitrogenifigens]
MKNKPEYLITDDIGYSWINSLEAEKYRNPINRFMYDACKSFEERLKDYLTENLKRLGYSFNSPDAFLLFCTERVSRLSFTESPNEYKFYLDYKSETNQGTFIGAYNDTVSFTTKENTVKATFGRQLV